MLLERLMNVETLWLHLLTKQSMKQAMKQHQKLMTEQMTDVKEEVDHC